MTAKELREELEGVPDDYEVMVVGEDFSIDARDASVSGYGEKEFIIEI
ncbi:hypothetical protein LI168_14470 [Desulfovibrio desulfuricans]|nr:hypothetical protein [Desulfovibrio desulfuricans]MCB6543333.1 hypothetical protein [Desulfovibrio desulfuricans]MCB6554421.1 hypothetical protein [Desulfovibrio desulfuricans]MCB6566272.1 hypothetical protein [Desulfovibrio desulfuricans]MCB7347422.1 hypothetical protein [Desulfovibrio desulfuricans]MCQ5219371.1 hypothetical protein [Desulfovibrio desulfuricans]